jgi:hypothetical protein
MRSYLVSKTLANVKSASFGGQKVPHLVGKAPHLVAKARTLVASTLVARTLIARNLVGKAHHLVLTIFLIITLFLGLNEPSIIEKAKKSGRGVHKMGECVMCETKRLVNG